MSSTTPSTTPAPPTPSPQPPHSTPEGLRALSVGNLDPQVTEQILRDFFSAIGPVVLARVVSQDRNSQNIVNFAYVEFRDRRSAEQALATLNGHKLYNYELRLNWAPQNHIHSHRDENSPHRERPLFKVFVGDLNPEVSDEALGKAFAHFGSIAEARVMWDAGSGKSRGYGFVAFRYRQDAERAIFATNGRTLFDRPVRVNWANPRSSTDPGSPAWSARNLGHGPPRNTQVRYTYQEVLTQAPYYNTTVYIGNIPPTFTVHDLIPIFQPFGYIVEAKTQSDRGFGFVKFDTHENAANAIVRLHGSLISGRSVRCSWGKERPPEFELIPGATGFPMGYGQGGNTFPYAYPSFGATAYGIPEQNGVDPTGGPVWYGLVPTSQATLDGQQEPTWLAMASVNPPSETDSARPGTAEGSPPPHTLASIPPVAFMPISTGPGGEIDYAAAAPAGYYPYLVPAGQPLPMGMTMVPQMMQQVGDPQGQNMVQVMGTVAGTVGGQ
ncbi:RNA-binding domain-containing protein [Gonapodya prolifera JEL478]|uniref:RNA-binding domain-containing protein n=1 Tax=Gonapodya prolifera (strain JEL478) TaxID=1344416 RepID=A0A139A5K9_GONPJ|nr:RNA-binding domain-containing protein [Gonapodya prolifera JEL478]|eukprot:KXS12080.1 RNA-binding domain-containing protein [Gonapodya prolifera JEL478]